MHSQNTVSGRDSAPAPLKFYLAGGYSRRLELLGYQAELERAGHSVTSRWLDGSYENTGGDPYDAPRSDKAKWAWVDIADIEKADWFVVFEDGPEKSTGRGGRLVEFGMALKSFKACAVIGYDGDRHNIFYALPFVLHFGTWAEFFKGVVRP